MRLFCELFLVVVLIWLGWSKSFQDWVNQIRGVQPAATTQPAQVSQTTVATAPATAPRQPFLRYAPPRPASTPSGDWMWDPAHRSPLDRPAYKTGASAQQTPSQGYWIDSRGIRHSVNATPSP